MLQDIIATLGIANPQLSTNWQSGTGLPSEVPDLPLELRSNPENGEWLAPAAGFFNKGFAKRLMMPNGEALDESSWVLALTPQVRLRIARLYGLLIEGRSAQTDRTQRPTPAYFAYHGTSNVAGEPEAGVAKAGEPLQIQGGRMTIHDIDGQAIDPMATVSIFALLLSTFPVLAVKAFTELNPPNLLNAQLQQLVDGLSGDDEVRVRLIDLFRTPLNNGPEKFTNLIPLHVDSGWYRLTNPEQGITVEDPPEGSKERFRIGAATFGTLDDNFTPQALGENAPLSTLKRDFLTLYAVDLRLHLLGDETREQPFEHEEFDIRVFHDEIVRFLPNGNQFMAAAGQVLAENDRISLAVSPVLESDFAVAADPATSEWPDFPAGNDGTIPGRLIDVETGAHFLTAPDDPRDVFLRMEIPPLPDGAAQLSPGTAVRIYHRKFLPDAREGRGNGAGNVLNDTHQAGFLLKNPFGLRPTEAIPINPRLSFDLIAVNRSGSKRAFGLLGADVEAGRAMDAAELGLVNFGTNGFNDADERGVAPAGLLGLPSPPLNTIPPINNLQDAVDVALSLEENNQPRIAPRLPLMTRNETILGGRDAAGNWSALLGGLWLRKDSRSSVHRLGSPGSPGGEEFLGIGIQTNEGFLAYELSRMALRRCRSLADRLDELGTNDSWQAPVPALSGNFSVALLQSITPGAESPGLQLIPDAAFEQFPDTWNELVNDAASILPSSVASLSDVQTRVNNLANSPLGDFLFKELRREVYTSRFGRQDALLTLKNALEKARNLIYIETSAFSMTSYLPGTGEETADSILDYVSIIAQRMEDQPNLKVIIAVDKIVSVGPGYTSFAARAYQSRMQALQLLQEKDKDRVVLFHPIGFPGRPVRLMHNLVIIDDVWLLGGSGSFNRRGFRFDGNLSVACVDREIEAGCCSSIHTLRRDLMENHLGVQPNPGSPSPDFPHPNETRLADLNEAFYAVADLLRQGGSGLIEPVFDGKVTGETPIAPAAFPHRDLADPDGGDFSVVLASLLAAFIGLDEAGA